MEAAQLTIGDPVLAAGSTTGTIEGVEFIHAPQTMYNLTVEWVATYLVGAGQWVVHNADICDFRRFGSKAEADLAQATNQLAFPTSGIGNRQEKWIARVDTIDEDAFFGKTKHYTHRMDIFTEAGTLDWLERNVVDYTDYYFALKEGLDLVPDTETLVKNVIALTKVNEPGWYGITQRGIGLFNRNIDKIISVRIR